MSRKYHNITLPTSPRHRQEEPLNNYSNQTGIRKAINAKQPAISSSSRCLQNKKGHPNKDQHRTQQTKPFSDFCISKSPICEVYKTKYYYVQTAISRAISGIVHAHHSCSGKRGKLSGSRLSTIFKFASILVSDTSGGYFRIFWTK